MEVVLLFIFAIGLALTIAMAAVVRSDMRRSGVAHRRGAVTAVAGVVLTVVAIVASGLLQSPPVFAPGEVLFFALTSFGVVAGFVYLVFRVVEWGWRAGTALRERAHGCKHRPDS